jgi:lysophospholipase L1-like esterase
MRTLSGAVLFLALASCSKRPPSVSEDKTEVRYLALGDSFTIGTGSTPAESFPARLAERWRAQDRHVTLKNLGVNGYTTDDVAAREIPEVAPFHPTLVTLAVGANDRVRGVKADVYRAHVRAILRSILDAGVLSAAIVTLPQPEWSLSPAAAAFGDPAQIGADIVAFNTVLREETEKVGARYIDLYPLMHHQAETKMLARDGLHPSARAHDEWAAKLFELIR